MVLILFNSPLLSFIHHTISSHTLLSLFQIKMATAYDRIRELETFDETKSGVKGLVDDGITKIPPFFIQPPEQGDLVSLPVQIPVIDLTAAESDAALRRQVVEKVKSASEIFGFFQVVNHGIPLEVLDEMLEGVRLFNEAELDVKKKYYTRDTSKKVVYNSNFDLYQAPAANWRDTMFIAMAPELPVPEELPAMCRDVIFKYTDYIKRLGVTLFELQSEALGLKPSYLTEIECNKGLSVLTHYYPPCPEPHLTVGTTKHSDSDFLTVLLQDSIGGLQVLYENHWIDVPPVHGALVINVGDLLQLISNDKLKSVEHRVLANSIGPRVSVACFFSTHLNPTCNRVYGPIEELITEVNPPLYKETTLRDFTLYYNGKGLDGRSALDYFRL